MLHYSTQDLGYLFYLDIEYTASEEQQNKITNLYCIKEIMHACNVRLSRTGSKWFGLNFEGRETSPAI